jgi:diguanylate cyclase (GGDEF)-like protein
MGDVLLLTLVVGGTALLAGRSRGPWLLLASGIALNVVGDTFNLFQSSIGSSHAGTVINGIAWPTAIWLMSAAMWLPRWSSDPLTGQRPTGFLLPGVAAACGLLVLFAGTLHHVNGVAVGLATATLLVVFLRTGSSVRALRVLTDERRQLSLTDQLTGLRNRRYLFEVLDAFFAEQAAADSPRSLACLFIDLERFKEINDSFGHPAGDEILKQVGERLASSLRPTDVVARIGGDEFAVLLLGADEEHAASVARQIGESLQRPFSLDAVRAQLGASVGIAMAPRDATDGATLIWCADVAMYRAKFGTTSYALYEQDLSDRGNHLRLAEQLRAAIDAEQLTLHYQPQLDLRSGEIATVEALVRWPHPTLGLIPPAKFLPLAEEAGFMADVTALVLGQALEQCAAWRSRGSEVNVSVNVSASDLTDPALRRRVEELLARYGLPPSCLVIEITETSIIVEFEKAREAVGDLRALGVVVSIDDFGAGFTSLAYLSGLAVGELKLDRALIAQLTGGHTRRDLQLVKATVELGHALGLRVVAEGIDSQETLDLVSGLGCDIAQGYFIATPKPAHKLALRASAQAPVGAGSATPRERAAALRTP